MLISTFSGFASGRSLSSFSRVRKDGLMFVNYKILRSECDFLDEALWTRDLRITCDRVIVCIGASVPVSLTMKSWYTTGTWSFVTCTSDSVSIQDK